MSEQSEVTDCDYPWTGFMPHSEGHILCCCYGSTAVGNLTEQTPEQVWNGPTMRSLRASLSTGVIHSVCLKAACKFVMGSRAQAAAAVEETVSLEGFDEKWYLASYYDVRDGIHTKRWTSAADHYQRQGFREFRARNAREWQAWAEAEASQGRDRHELARLSWEGEPRIEGDHVRLSFRALNASEKAWDASSVRAGAWITPRLLSPDLRKVCESQLAGPVQPGESTQSILELPVANVTGERSFAIVDLFSLRSGQRFSETLTRPLVLALSRTATGELRIWATKVPEPRLLRADRPEETC